MFNGNKILCNIKYSILYVFPHNWNDLKDKMFNDCIIVSFLSVSEKIGMPNSNIILLILIIEKSIIVEKRLNSIEKNQLYRIFFRIS